ncbi:hypothetical protein DFH09DRAFT_1079626 [Mycena vulgaris]|nr:hypothetical protein DFH09DRAFT_1079626 [Mycena vulgaris]
MLQLQYMAQLRVTPGADLDLDLIGFGAGSVIHQANNKPLDTVDTISSLIGGDNELFQLASNEPVLTFELPGFFKTMCLVCCNKVTNFKRGRGGKGRGRQDNADETMSWHRSRLTIKSKSDQIQPKSKSKSAAGVTLKTDDYGNRMVAKGLEKRKLDGDKGGLLKDGKSQKTRVTASDFQWLRMRTKFP